MRTLVCLVALVAVVSGGEVFPVQSAAGRYKIRNVAEARTLCGSFNGRLASLEELEIAQIQGLDHCNCGFLDGGEVALPLSNPRPGCGSTPGVRECPSNPADWGGSGWDAFCVPEKTIECENKYAFGPFALKYRGLPNDLASLYTDITFPADGKVAGWSYYSLRPDMEAFAAVYRPLGDRKFALVGRNRLPTGRVGPVNWIVDRHYQIFVRKGDFIGIHYGSVLYYGNVKHTVIPYAHEKGLCGEDGACVEASDLSNTFVIHRHEEQLFHKRHHILDLNALPGGRVTTYRSAPALRPTMCAYSGAGLPTEATTLPPESTKVTEATTPREEMTPEPPVVTEAVTEPTEAATEPTEPATEPTEPETEATEPATEPTEPATEPTEPETEATEPATEPTEPATEPTEPETEATEPATEPTEPETEATEPATEATEPATEATELATEPTEPATEPTEPETKATEPATEPTEPATEPTEVVTETTEAAKPPPTKPTTEPTTESSTSAPTTTEPKQIATEAGEMETGEEAASEVPCHFPFMYHKHMISSCTLINSDKPWCSTAEVYDGRHWRYCHEGDGVVVELPCHFPFEYNNRKDHNMCIKAGSANYWCATAEKYGPYSWRNCHGGDPIPEDMPCHYPFVFEGKEQNTCITKGASKHWCAVERGYTTENWRYCREGDKFPEEVPCHLPFDYNGKMISACISENANRPWCSTVAVYDTKNWRYCRQVEIFLLRGELVKSVAEAKQKCQAANMKLAMRRDVTAAFENGSETCVCGYVGGGEALNLVHTPREDCSPQANRGINVCPDSDDGFIPICVKQD